MDIPKIKKQLKKINAIFSAIEEEGGPSQIEKDLLKSYVQGLYERIIADPKKELSDDQPLEKKKAAKRVEKIEKIESSIFDELEEVVEDVHQLEKSIPHNHLNGQEEKVISVVPPKSETATSFDHADAPIATLEETDNLVVDLFTENETKELSGKLSKMPIRDLNKGMGLNERIFTINELFGGEKEHFAKVIETLNGFTSQEEAQTFLAREVIYRYDWTNKSKIKKAREFIKLVKRRYL